jgi:hypothetical protein
MNVSSDLRRTLEVIVTKERCRSWGGDMGSHLAHDVNVVAAEGREGKGVRRGPRGGEGGVPHHVMIARDSAMTTMAEVSGMRGGEHGRRKRRPDVHG